MQVANIILDTGASRTLVREDLVPPYAMREGEVTVTCVHGDAITYPLAQITISVGPHKDVTVRAAVAKTLPVAVLIGRDVPQLMDLLNSSCQKPAVSENAAPALVAATRAQTEKQQESSTITKTGEEMRAASLEEKRGSQQQHVHGSQEPLPRSIKDEPITAYFAGPVPRSRSGKKSIKIYEQGRHFTNHAGRRCPTPPHVALSTGALHTPTTSSQEKGGGV